MSYLFLHGVRSERVRPDKILQIRSSRGPLSILQINTFELFKIEIEQALEREVIKDLWKDCALSILDLRQEELKSAGLLNIGERIYREIEYDYDYDFIICNGYVASLFQDSHRFSVTDRESHKSSAMLYDVGNIGKFSVFVDPYMKYNDSSLYIGKSGSFHWNMEEIQMNDTSTGILVERKWGVSKLESRFLKMLVVMSDTPDILINEYQSEILITNRDKKLGQILE